MWRSRCRISKASRSRCWPPTDRPVVPHATALLDNGDGRIRALLPLTEHRLLQPDELRVHDPALESFTNVNTADDLARVDAILRQQTLAEPRSET